MKIQSNNIIFMDVTDTRKVDVHISSNHPTVQIFDLNSNERARTPDWSIEPLELIPTVYADSIKVTDSLSKFEWRQIIGEEEIILTTTDKVLTITDNQLNETIPMIRYKFRAWYNNTEFSNEIVFSLITAGKNGTDGYTPQKGVDYFDGKNGQDGKSVGIKGVAYTNESFVVGAQVTLYSDSEYKNQITIGGDADTVDGYLVDGYLCVYTGEYFIWTGKIQGPQGQKGESTFLYIRYADDQNGNGFDPSPVGKKYIGFYRGPEESLPNDINRGYDTWKWSKYVGDDAKSISLNASTQVFRVGKDGKISPEKLTITPHIVNTSITDKLYSINGNTFSTTLPKGLSIDDSNKITITGKSMDANVNSIAIRMGDGTYSDTLTIYKVYDGDKGEDASVVFLTNENITFAADSNGRVAGITVNCDVVAYTGTTKVIPTVGVISSLDLRSGMSLGEITTEDNQVKIPIIIEDNATLGSEQNTNGTIKIPIFSPIETDLYLTWSKVNSGAKGDIGISIKSTTVWYGISDSASTRPSDTSWQSTIPTVADGKYLWTKTVIDYTDDTIADTITYTYAKQGVKGDTGSTGSSVTVSKIEYQAGTSATTAPTSTWSNNVVSVAEGNYLWTKTTFSDNKVAYGVAKQGAKGDKGDTGATGRGVSKITEEYYQSTSATSQSGGSWSTTVPTWVDGKYIWTRSVITYTDSTSSTTSPICISGQKGATGGTGASGVGISSVDVWYYQSSSATSLSGGTWVTTAPTWADGKYIWTKTITTYTNNTTDETNAVCITGQKGATGVGVKSVTEYYLATASSSGVTTSTSGWTTTIQTITSDKKYLWNYEVITYTDDTTSSTSPIIIGVFGNTGSTGATGKGIKSVTEYYLASTLSSGVTTSTTGWTTTIQPLTSTNKYLWNYELIAYTDDTTATINPVIIGVYGDKGDKGNTGDKGADAYTVILTNESHIFAGNVSSAIAASATTQVLAYKGSTSQSVTIVSVDGKTASTSSTATSIAGLSFSCSALSGTSPTITFTCTTSFVSPSGTMPIVLTVDGVTITKMFTYSIAFKGATGAQGAAGTAASLVDITPSALYFKSTTGKDGTFTPDYIYLYPRFQTVTFSKWEYSVNGGTTWVAASGANGLTISTYNSVANTLRIAKTSTLYTDAVTSISFRCVSSNASVYDTVSIVKIYDVVDLEMGVIFQLYAPKGYLITNETPEIELQVFAYEGGQEITNATFKWYSWNGETWGAIGGATGTSLTIDKTSVMKTSVYKCEMTYDGEVYEATATVEDKTDIYESLIRVIAKQSSTNRMYWILYTTVYSEDGERDSLLGPISETAPTSPTTGAYWYKIDTVNYTVTLMKYSGTAWTTTTDTQELLYDWFLFRDATDMITLGAQSKVKIITANDFSRVCSIQCNIFDSDYNLFSRSSQVLNDPSDPIVSTTEPPNPIDKQLWIKIADNGTYIISIWDEATRIWMVSEADSQNKVHVEKPTVYSAGDIWIVGGDYQPTIYVSGVAQTTKHLVGTMLKAQFVSSTYSDSDWVEALNYKERIDDLTAQLNIYNQFFDFDETGLTMGAKNLSGQISEFKTKLTNTELGFYQGENKVAYINNNQLNISKAEINQSLSIVGTSPMLSIGGFSFVVESNGSLSIITNN